MPLQLITAPDTEPVSIGQVRTQVKQDLQTWDDKLTLLAIAARRFIERTTHRCLVTQTWELIDSHFPREECRPLSFDTLHGCRHHKARRHLHQFPFLELPKGQLASVTSVKYIDAAGVEQLVDPTVYSVDTASVPGRLHLAYGMSWPAHRYQWDAVKVRYVVGTSVDQVPEPLKQAILLLVSQMWTNDVPEVTGTIISSVKFSYEALVGPYRLIAM